MASGSAFTLDFKPSYTPKSIREFLGEIHFIGDQRRRITRLEEYVNSLEEEQRKVDAFKRELPLCMLLLSDAIEALREEEMKWRKPVLEEFMSPVMSKTDGVKMEKDRRDKMNWMSSVQLWGNINNNDNNNNNNNYNNNYKKNEASDVKEKKDKESEGYLIAVCKNSNQGGAFMPFKGFLSSRKEEKESVFPFPNLSLLSPRINTPSAESGADGGLNSNGICKGLGSSMASGQANLQPRKSRRCWSPELHRRFVNALHQLGGPQVATPKQIRELMKVDGLTNDEVKSHLQKYRLHTRRVPGTAAAAAHKQVVVLGGMWVPHDHYQASKEGDSQSSSPQSPLHWTGTAQGIYNDDYEEDDAESEFYLERPHSSIKQ